MATARLGGHEDPTTRPLVKATLKRLAREYEKPRKQAKRLTSEALAEDTHTFMACTLGGVYPRAEQHEHGPGSGRELAIPGASPDHARILPGATGRRGWTRQPCLRALAWTGCPAHPPPPTAGSASRANGEFPWTPRPGAPPAGHRCQYCRIRS